MEQRMKIAQVPLVDGYEGLMTALVDALDQAQHGKGKDRHANAEPFHEQSIMRHARQFGLGYPLGQAAKKMEECRRLTLPRAKAEILGAINYLASAYLRISEIGYCIDEMQDPDNKMKTSPGESTVLMDVIGVVDTPMYADLYKEKSIMDDDVLIILTEPMQEVISDALDGKRCECNRCRAERECKVPSPCKG